MNIIIIIIIIVYTKICVRTFIKVITLLLVIERNCMQSQAETTMIT